MSSGEPMWFCHECNAEMRPLMVPDPHCASCNGTFVEKMENPTDDPREFQHHIPGQFEPDQAPPGMENFLFSLRSLMDRANGDGPPSRPARTADRSSPGSGLRLEFRSTGPGTRTMVIGGPNTLGSRGGSRATNSLGARPSPGDVPTMSEYLDPMQGPPRDRTITGPMMAQYLMALLGSRSGDPLAGLLGMGGQHGRMGMGDYVFNQEALDEIITNLMENGNSTRPVAASTELIEDLPREVLEIESPTLEKDCAVCKDQFKLETEDPDEQVVVSLPCQHTFHEGCIIPWLKSSGTCPVCRHALVPQPENHPSGQGPGGSGRRSSSVPPRSPASAGDPSSQDAGGIFSPIFGHVSGGNSGSGTAGSTSNGNGNRESRQHRWTSNSSRSRNHNFPGSWGE